MTGTKPIMTGTMDGKITVHAVLGLALGLVLAVVCCCGAAEVSPVDSPDKPASAATIEVQYDNKVGEINPFMYGGGFETVGGAVNLGLDAQMLDGRSFEEEDVNQDGVSDKWLQIGWGDNVPRYDRVGRYSFHARYCQKISITAHADGERGIQQTGLAVAEGKNYTATLHLKRRSRGPVSVCLATGEKIIAKATISDVSAKWKKYTVSLTPDVSSAEAEFRVTLADNGSLWVDQVSLIPEDSYKGHGTRKDIMENILDLSPTIIRWPGGWFAEVCRWKRGIGDVDKRPLIRKYYSDARRKNNPSWESNSFGTDEFMQFCRDVGAVPLLTVNSAFDTRANLDEMVNEAAEWVEYCNGDTSTKFGALRAANGHPEPYRVRYWNIGNEVWEMGAEDYARRFIRFALAMKEKDPSIKLLAVGGITPDRKWNRTLLTIAGDYLDYIDLHHYESDADYSSSVAMPLKYGKSLQELKETISSLAPGKNIKLAIMEWNSNSNWQDASKLKEGLFAASWLNVLERHGDIVEMAAAWPLLRRVQPYGNHVADHGMVWYDNHRVYVSPTGLAVSLYRRNYAPERVKSTVHCDTFDAGDRKNVPYLDVVATRDPGKGLLVVKVVNKNPEEAIAADIELKGLPSGSFKGRVTVSTLTGPDIWASNRADHPDDVHIEKSVLQVTSPRFTYRLPAHSATVLRFQRAINQ